MACELVIVSIREDASPAYEVEWTNGRTPSHGLSTGRAQRGVIGGYRISGVDRVAKGRRGKGEAAELLV